jgi:hypothetical protein
MNTTINIDLKQELIKRHNRLVESYNKGRKSTYKAINWLEKKYTMVTEEVMSNHPDFIDIN